MASNYSDIIPREGLRHRLDYASTITVCVLSYELSPILPPPPHLRQTSFPLSLSSIIREAIKAHPNYGMWQCT